MIVPSYWAEARLKQRRGNQQITVRRFGWSDRSQDDAQQHADSRAREALNDALAGADVVRREPKVAYNGADGVPIREEVISRHGDTVITRNGYGALCLNTENVLFADLDFEQNVPSTGVISTMLMVLLLAVGVGLAGFGWGIAFALLIGGLLLSYALAQLLFKAWLALTGGAEQRAYRRIQHFSRQHPDWHLRLYRTPAGFRVLAVHQVFDPADPAVHACFLALHTDPLYQQMCQNQRCFRARVSPKPWRIGIGKHMRPRPGIWPISPEQLPARQQWVAAYEAAAARFASCRFVEALGSKTTHPNALAVQQLHDQLCRADSTLALA